MKKFSILLILFLILFGYLFSEKDTYFLQHPALTPDGNKVVFSYDSDLWMVNSNGGIAYRLTGMKGKEIYPRISPDGKYIAFSGNQNGNYNVYIMSIDGGDIKQLTYLDRNDEVDSWSWDSKYIYFTSNRYNNFTEYKVSIDGGTPTRLFPNYFNTIHDLIQHPETKAYYFTDTWESYRYSSRKGYRGPYNADIKSYNPETKEFIVHTKFKGKDFQPIVDRSGNIYFLSEQSSNEFNLYKLENEKKVRLTNFKVSILNPQISSSGDKIVFEKDYQLYIYNTKTKKTRKIKINLFQNNTLSIEQNFDVKGKITDFNISDDHKKVVFVSRGELFVSDIEGKFIKQIETGKGRVMEVYWLKDNKNIIFSQTVDGWLNWFKISGDGGSKEEQLTFDKANNRKLSFDSKKNRAVYLSGRNRVCLMNLEEFKTNTIVEKEIWGIYGSTPWFSPDDNYIVFTVRNNFEKDIIIHDLSNDSTVNITNSGVSEDYPFWSPDGKYLYFASDRYKATFPTGSKNMKIYRLSLQKLDEKFKIDEFYKLFEQTEQKKDKQEKKESIKIDFKDMIYRWEMVSPSSGQQFSPFLIKQKEKSILLFLSDHDGEGYNLWKKVFKPFKKPELKKIKGAKTRSLDIKSSDNNYYLLINGVINQLDLSQNKIKPVKINFSFTRNLRAEFYQMFREVWANIQENYYDPDFHGQRWVKIKNYYEGFLSHINSRANLRQIIFDMLGELNSSHLGFYSYGEEEKTFFNMKTMNIGIIFDEQNPYKIDKIVKNSPADKKHIDLKRGDMLVKVNNKNIDFNVNRELYFTSSKFDDEIILTFKRDKSKFDVKIHPQRTSKFISQLYDEWIDNNQRRVDRLSEERIAYIHMKNMGQRELRDFIIELTTEWYKREGLILDLRYNTGGNVHNDILNFLIKRPYLKWKYRGGKFAHQPNFAPSGKPIVLLINEQSLSDAEMTAAAFKALKLGKIIGSHSYKWLIFTTGKSLVDGSYYRLPSWGCFTLEGKDLEMSGVKPDILIDNTFKDRLENEDPQLERAIKEVIKEIKK